MIKYLKLQFKMGKIDEAYLDKLVGLGKITAEQKVEVMA